MIKIAGTISSSNVHLEPCATQYRSGTDAKAGRRETDMDIQIIGGLRRARTADALLRAEALYPLSYEVAPERNRIVLRTSDNL